ncbi:MAG: hypothetical protein PSX71_00335 [bacterium]|nr:hypothetical protein [bacterium]
MNIHKWLWLTVLAGLLALMPLAVQAGAEQQKKMLDQLDQLDQLDHLDFMDLADKANACIRAHAFDCAEKKIADAARSAGSSQDKRALGSIRQSLLAERQRVAEDEHRRIAEQRRIAEEQARAEAAQRQAEADAQPSTASQLVMFGSILAGKMQEQQAMKMASDAAAQRNWQNLQAAGQRQEQENQRLLSAAAASRNPPPRSAYTAPSMPATPAATSQFPSTTLAGQSTPSLRNEALPATGDKVLDSQLAATMACGSSYDGPDDDPQTDQYCKIAAFDACLHRATGSTDHDQEGRANCRTLRSLLDAVGGKSQCRYCPYPY